MTQVIIILLGMGPLEPIEFGLDSGDGFVYSTLIDDNRDARIELLVPLDSVMAIAINHGVAGDDDCIIWDLLGSDVREQALPYEVPLFTNTAGGSLGIDYGSLLPPPAMFSAGEILGVTDGRLAEWIDPRFINDTGVAGLADFIALRESLPNFVGNVKVGDLRVRVESVVPEPTTFVLSLILLLLTIMGGKRGQLCSVENLGVV